MTAAQRFQGANVIDAGRLSPYWGEHAARYGFAFSYAAGRSVLDIACGTGYGIGLLKQAARFVAGVDVDPAALAEAKLEGGVVQADGLKLPFGDASFDVVTSFETLEHLHERALFLRELRRVIRSQGSLILSTPNAEYTRPVNGKPSNPFHIHEYEPDELRRELGAEFTVERLLGQTLDPAFGIPPFYDAQQKLSSDISTTVRLTGWKIINKLPVAGRDAISRALWRRPFYPAADDYNFSEQIGPLASVLVAVCRKTK